MTGETKGPGVPRWLKSAGAVLAGLATVIALSTAVDAVMHITGVFPPFDQRMEDARLYLLALAYRGVITVLGGWRTARLAPFAAMQHVLVLAAIGLALGGLGVAASLATDLGPVWYAVAVAVSGPICTLLGGHLNKGRDV
jgi:hypothetical protein